MLKRYLMPVLVVAVLFGISVAANAERDEATPPSQGVLQITEVESQAAAAVALLTTSRSPEDALPADVARKMDANAPFGMNPGLSRLAIGNATNSVYLIPARDRVCASLTVGEGANLTCRGTDKIAAGKSGAATVTLETGGIAIYGIVPNGVDAVSVQTGVSDSARIGTENNAFYTVVPPGTPLRTVSYSGPSGPVEFPIYDPRRVFGD